MKVKKLKQLLSGFDDNADVYLLRPACEDYDDYLDRNFAIDYDGDCGKIVIS